jgi:hypothetical protein
MATELAFNGLCRGVPLVFTLKLLLALRGLPWFFKQISSKLWGPDPTGWTGPGFYQSYLKGSIRNSCTAEFKPSNVWASTLKGLVASSLIEWMDLP